jgi:hypothetical protein
MTPETTRRAVRVLRERTLEGPGSPLRGTLPKVPQIPKRVQYTIQAQKRASPQKPQQGWTQP